MKTINELVTEELPTIKALLGESGNRIQQYGDTIQMRLKGSTPREIRAMSGGWFTFQARMRRHYLSQVEGLYNLQEILADMGYYLEFHYSDQGSFDATMILNKRCPCCGNY